MGCAVPVVATTVGAFPELVCDQENGKLIDPGSVAQMVDAVEHYINDPAMTANHGQNALAHVQKHFPIEREARQILEVYEKVQNQP